MAVPDSVSRPATPPLENGDTAALPGGLDTAETLSILVAESATRFREKIRTLVDPFSTEIKEKGERAAILIQSSLELRIDQIRKLQTGSWDHQSSIILAELIDLAHDNYTNSAQTATSAWKEFRELVLATIEKEHQASSKPTPSQGNQNRLPVPVDVLESAQAALVAARREFDLVFKRIREVYNGLENRFVRQYELDSTDSQILNLFRNVLSSGHPLVAPVRAQWKQPLSMSAADTALGATSASNSGSMAGKTISPIEQASRRQQVFNFMQPIDEHLKLLQLTPEERKAVSEAYRQGFMLLENLAYILSPPPAILNLWQRTFLSAAKVAVEGISSSEKRHSVCASFALIAEALGMFNGKR